MHRNYSLDLIRIIACLGVIMIHTSVSPIFHKLVNPGSIWFSECLVLNALSRFSVPIFVMLTGYFMLEPTKSIPIGLLYRKYILRLFIALIFWSLFYAFSLHSPIYPFGSQGGHFWYLGMAIGLYASLPVLRLIAAHPTVLKYFCYVWLFIMIYQFLGKFIKLPVEIDPIIFVEYAGFCLWGYYLKITDFNRKVIWAVGIVGLAITIVFPLIEQIGDSCFFNYSSPNVIANSIALFYCFTRMKINGINPKFANIIQNCSKCTFGIYLFHMWFLVETFSRVHRFVPNPIPLCLICVIGSFICGWLVTFVISKIPLLRKYII